MRNTLLILLLLCSSIIAKAGADGSQYIDALWLHGAVSHITMYCKNAKEVKSNILADVDYDYNDSSRTVTTYTLSVKGEHKVSQTETEMLNKNPKDDKELTFRLADNKIVVRRYAHDVMGNKTITNVTTSQVSDLGKMMYTYDKKGFVYQRIDYHDKESIASVSQFFYDSTGKSLSIETLNPFGQKISTSRYNYDAHQNLVDYSITTADNKTTNYSYRYVYDAIGNYTSCKYYIDGALVFTHYREIKYR